MKTKLIKEKSRLMDYLNLIDDQAEQAGGSPAEKKARARAYKVLADHIIKN